MKLNHLALAVIIASSGALFSCSDDTKKPETKKAETTETAETAVPKNIITQQVKMSDEELANVVETRYKGLIDLNNKMFEIVLSNPRTKGVWKEMKASVESYTREESGAAAKESVTLAPAESNPVLDEPLIISVDDKITYNQELFAQGIVAQIQHQLNTADITNKITSNRVRQIVENIFANLSMSTDLLTNDNAKTSYEIKAFQTKVSDSDDTDKTVTFDFGGLNAFSKINEKDVLSNLGSGEVEIVLKPIVIKPDYEEGSLAFQGFKVNRTLTAAEELSLHVSPLKVEFTAPEEDDFTLEIQGIEQNGTGVKFDPILGSFLGKTSGKIGDVLFSEKGAEAINYGYFTFNDNSIKNDQGNYDLGGDLTFHFHGEAFQQRAELPIQPKQSAFTIDLKNLSPETLEAANHLAQLVQFAEKNDKSDAEMENQAIDGLNALTDSLYKNNTQIQLTIAQETDQGNANVNATFKPREGAAAIEWKDVIEKAQQDPMVLAMLLQSNIDFTIDLKVNASLLAAFGLPEGAVEVQTMGMVKKDGDDYVVHIENSSQGLLVNGQKMM